MIEDSLLAGKHVLSQKPFVLDLDLGERLVQLAEQKSVRLAVNQNARWAPHFAYMREAVRSGLLGEVISVHCSVHWDHSWCKGTEFEKVRHLILYDYAIHWFDMLSCLMHPRIPARVYASSAASPAQDMAPPLLGQAIVEYEDAQASLAFDGHTRNGKHARNLIVGTRGTIATSGPKEKQQALTLSTSKGSATVPLTGCWFPDGFHGTMGELLCAIEEGREPTISGRNNLRSLELCFAAVASAERKEPVVPGSVRRLPE
jgi:predicted dehydrogenase